MNFKKAVIGLVTFLFIYRSIDAISANIFNFDMIDLLIFIDGSFFLESQVVGCPISTESSEGINISPIL